MSSVARKGQVRVSTEVRRVGSSHVPKRGLAAPVFKKNVSLFNAFGINPEFRVRAGFFHSMEWMAGEERPWLHAAVLEEVRTPLGGLTSLLIFLSLAVALKSDRSEELMVNQSESNFSLHEGRGDG